VVELLPALVTQLWKARKPGLIPALIVTLVLAASALVTPIGLNSTNGATCGYGYGYGGYGYSGYGYSGYGSAGGVPSVSGVSPSSGLTSGGSTVVITGCGFTGATSVQFGTLAAASFTIDSDTQVTAVSPAHASDVVVDVSVTTSSGTSPANPPADQFEWLIPPVPVIGSLNGTLNPFPLTASAMTVTGFAYAGNVSLVTKSGPVIAMELTMTSASIDSFSYATFCYPARLDWTAYTSSTASAPAGLTLYALEFAGVVNGAAVDWTPTGVVPATVPAAQPIPGGAGTISGPITATVVQVYAPQLDLPGMSWHLLPC
jgi:hypothetical protein